MCDVVISYSKCQRAEPLIHTPRGERETRPPTPSLHPPSLHLTAQFQSCTHDENILSAVVYFTTPLSLSLLVPHELSITALPPVLLPPLTLNDTGQCVATSPCTLSPLALSFSSHAPPVHPSRHPESLGEGLKC